MGRGLHSGLAVSVLALPLAPLAAPVLAATHPLAALCIRSFFSALCHQNPARSFMVHGAPIAVCVRCLGIYCGVAAGSLLPADRVTTVRCLALAVLLNLLDVFTGAWHLHGNLPWPRFVCGLLLGLGTGALLFLPWRSRQHYSAL